jgi:hypothetical protein
VLIRIPSAAGGEEGIAASILRPSKPRFTAGAPVVIHVAGGVQAGSARGRPEYVGFGFVEIHFAFPGGGEGDQRSGGTYDFRGPNCIRALADVIRFATGRLADKQGKRIGDLVPGMKVLTGNCGIVGSSHGGNACGLAMAMFGQEFPDLAWYASMESPYGEGAANVELGGHESGVNPAYNPQTGVLDLSRLAWSQDLLPGLFRKQMPADTRQLKGAFFFDLNGDGRFSPGDDFPANCFVGDDGQGIKAWYSPRILAEADRRKLIGGDCPRHIPTLEEAKEFWRYRDAAPSIPEAVRKFPDLAVIVYANQRDHVQAAPDHGHILEQVEGFRKAKARFVRLNPDRAYVEWVLAAGPGPRGLGPGGFPLPGFPKAAARIPDNPAGQAFDRSIITAALEPAVLPLGLCMQAAVCELADRVQAGNWAANLDAVLFPDAPATNPGAAAREDRPLPAQPRPSNTRLTRHVAADAGSREAPLLFCIGVHIEPFGATVSKLVAASNGARAVPPGRPQRPDFHQPAFFQKHVGDLRTLADIVERHGGKLTVQAQTPFTQLAVDRRETVLGDLQKRGHEIALHFHEDAHLGRRSEALPVATWTAVMKEEVALLKQAGATQVRYFSGGNLYGSVLEAAGAAGLEVMSDHKNPRQQRTDERLIGVVPWRPAGGPRENDVADFARHDPHGKIIYLPDGQFPRVDFASMRRSPALGGDAAYFDFLAGALEDSLRAARADRVNVFHITVHTGEFRGPPGGKPFDVIDQWLGEVVVPLVKAGKLRWATFSEMAAAFAAWEQANPGVEPRSGGARANSKPSPASPLPPGAEAGKRQGYITLVVNVHDWTRAAESAETVLRLLALFEKHKVRGEFYLTAPVVEAYAQQRPEAIRRLRESDMTLSYHFRPPHPAYGGFDQRLHGLDDQSLAAALRDYETYRLDPGSGELDRTQPGGYAYVAKTLGRKPVVVSALSRDPRIKTALLGIYRGMGAQMTMEYHESGTDLSEPFRWRQGLLIRPSDFSITRWASPGEAQESFWWNRLDTPQAEQFNPIAYLRRRLTGWEAQRLPLITALIHENDFTRRGSPGWAWFYYAKPDAGPPLSPPFDLHAPDRTPRRTAAQQEAIWKAYDELVAYAAANLHLVTSADIVQMASRGK